MQLPSRRPQCPAPGQAAPALIDELLRLALMDLLTDVHRALARTDGFGLHELLHAFGQSFAERARYANLLLERQLDAAAEQEIRAAIIELTARAIAAGTVSADITVAGVTALAAGLRGLIQAGGEVSSSTWPRFLDLHLAGMGAPTTLIPGQHHCGPPITCSALISLMLVILTFARCVVAVAHR
jgi:hypothetical protein